MLTLAVFVTYLPALVVPYGLTDDYLYLALAEPFGLSSPPYAKSVVHAAAAEGRPIWGLAVDAALSMAGAVDNLRFVRLIGVIGIVVLALLLYVALERARIGRLPSTLITLLICSLPTFQLYASWTVSFSVPWASAVAGGASLVLVGAIDAPRRLKRNRVIAATVLILLAVLTYQPAAMFFWVFLAVALVGSIPDSARAVRLARIHFVAAAVALAIAYVVYKICVRLVGSAALGAERGAIVDDVWGKVEWLVRWPLYMALNLFDLRLSVWSAVLAGAVIVVGIPLWLLRKATRPWLYVALAAVLVPLTVLPNLVVEETYDWQAYRPLVAFSALIALYFGLGALAIWMTLREWLEGRASRPSALAAERVAVVIAVAFVALGLVVANRNVDTLIAEPQLTELRLLRGQVAALPDAVQRVAFVLSGPAEGDPDLPMSDEFGMPSTVPWYPTEPLLLLLLREQDRLAEPHPVVQHVPWYATPPEGVPVVNLNGLLGSARTKVDG